MCGELGTTEGAALAGEGVGVFVSAARRPTELFENRGGPQGLRAVFDPPGDEAEVRGLKQSRAADSDTPIVADEEMLEGLAAFDQIGI